MQMFENHSISGCKSKKQKMENQKQKFTLLQIIFFSKNNIFYLFFILDLFSTHIPFHPKKQKRPHQ